METNEMGFTEEVVEPQADEVNIDELVEGTVDKTQDDAAKPEPAIKNQQDFNAALRNRLQEKEASVSRRYQNSPEYMLGQELLRERMQNGMSAEQAYQQILDERVKAKAESYKQNPQNFYEDYLRSQQTGRQQDDQQGDEASSLAEQLIEARANGLLPEDFSSSDITPEFIADVQEFGVRGAAKIFNASHVTTDRVVSKLNSNQRLPRTMKTDGANVPVPKLDFDHMSDEEFAKLDSRFAEALAKGKKIRF